MIVDPSTTPTSGEKGLHTLHLSQAGGLTQFGAFLDTLDPGAWSSQRHWHSAEDEFLYLLSGTATLRDDQGLTDLFPGDACCWPHGKPDGHHLTNRGDVPARWLIVGSRCTGDVCTYPDDGRRQINDNTTWRIETADGRVLKSGDLPTELLNLSAPWGRPWDGTPRPTVIRAGSVAGEGGSGSYPAPYAEIGDYLAHPLSDAGGLTQFGAFTEILMPGARSSQRHWHSDEDEFLYTLDGIVTLHDNDGPRDLPPGTCVCWPAGVANAHCLENRTALPVTYFVAGSRLPEDEVSYPDIDLHYTRRNGLRSQTRKDGTLYPGWPREVNR
ncbi:cupin domain-containing protein [Tabrizicola sp.]|uniref:cupin domain-containing protein n=1 Tax=Tabrizicola sp. TaxID=2005166 RepID=UPI00273590F9|nr:cupin domain-containing protein [Tabrizicola sp.]MDP3195859.1 cupin domain-containing protein [Tabrizicola sp.]